MKSSISYVVKRSGLIENFNKDKIIKTLHRVTNSTNSLGQLTDLVMSKLEDTVSDIKVSAENISSVISEILSSSNTNKNTSTDGNINVGQAVKEYVDNIDWRVHANANLDYSLGGLILNLSGKVTANYWLHYIYKPEIGKAHVNGDFHIHDLDFLGGYCAGWSLQMLLNEGFCGVRGKISSNPPKHLSSALMQMVNFLGTLQNEWAGAQAFSSFDTYLAPFVKKDNLTYEQVKQQIQMFVFNLNVPTRWGTQTPFTNITLDWHCPEDLREIQCLIGGEESGILYGDCQKEMDMINKAFIEVMTEGDGNGRVFTFPIPTYNITKDFDWDCENADLLFEMTAKYGVPYFQNFLNSDLKPNQVRSMCCRLQLDLRELLKRGGGLFGSAEQTGSIGVVTLNMARLGYLSKGNSTLLIEKLNKLLELAKNSLETKRKVLSDLLEKGLYPYTKRYLGQWQHHFSTIGVNGMNEMCMNHFRDRKENLYESKKAREFCLQILDNIREKMKQFQVETGNMYNLEATPAEGAMYRFAKKDKELFGNDILQANTKSQYPFYTNSSQLPVACTDDPYEALDLQEPFQTKYTGGTVLHLYTSERIESIEVCKKLVKSSLERYKIPYLSITPTFSICPKHGYINGEHEYCPKCDEELFIKKHTVQINI